MSSVNLAASSSGFTTHTLPVRDAAALESTEGVNWRAVWAGAIAACALSFLLLTLGVGLGLSSVSPWRYEGIDAGTLAISSIIWVIVTQLAASGIGGYMAGRLRGRWTRLRDHEVYFRDTAHGLLAWGLSTLIMAGLMGLAAAGALNQSARLAGTAATVAATAAGGDSRDDSGYWIDAMLRMDMPVAAQGLPAPVMDPATDATLRAQAGRILAHALRTGSLPASDATQLATIVSQRTGMPLADAQRRVNDIHAQARRQIDEASTAARQKADAARKASAYSALWMCVALMAGAFIAAWLATFGGRQRDAANLAA
ncbi:MAG: hypothetical protein QM742_16525 [Aquabacterium sp.]